MNDVAREVLSRAASLDTERRATAPCGPPYARVRRRSVGQVVRTAASSGRSVLLIAVLAMATGCLGPKLAMDLLHPATVNPKPLRSEAAMVLVGIDPRIRNREKIDDTLKQSLEIALRNANLFGNDNSRPYRIYARITVAQEAAMSFGSFKGQLEVAYQVLDGAGNKILDQEIHTVSGSDIFYFSGAKRHRRARAVTIAKNVLEFVRLLQARLEQ